jgi:hypothetical protein
MIVPFACDDAVGERKEIYSRDRSSPWVGGPSPHFYEELIFALYTFFTATLTLDAKFCGLQSPINELITGFHLRFTRKIGAGGKSGFGVVSRGISFWFPEPAPRDQPGEIGV